MTTTVWVEDDDYRGDVVTAVVSLLRLGATVELKRAGDDIPDVVITPAPCVCCARVMSWHRTGCASIVLRDRMPDDEPAVPDPGGRLDVAVELLDGSVELRRALVPISLAAVGAVLLIQGGRLPRRLREIVTEA